MKSAFFDTFKPLAGGMRPLEIVEYLLLALMTVLLPYDWQLAMWLMPLLAVNTLCRIVAARRVGNPGLTGASRWAGAACAFPHCKVPGTTTATATWR